MFATCEFNLMNLSIISLQILSTFKTEKP